VEQLVVAAIAFFGAAAGVAGGVGGAVLVVPLLLLTGADAPAAATVGLLSVATATAAAAPRQLAQRLANHRLAVTVELGASLGVVVGASLLAVLPEAVFRGILAAAIVAAVAAGLLGRPARGLEAVTLPVAAVGEQPGAIAGAYALGHGAVPYRAQRVPLGIGLAIGVGLVSGVTGTSGGYLKTPLMREVLGVPIKVAAATSTFASGVTAIAGLAVLLPAGAVELPVAAAAVVGASLGRIAGAALQARLPPRGARQVLAVLLVTVAVVLLWPS